MKIYTKKGDTGETSFFSGERVSKNNIIIEAFGDLDELNAIVGLSITNLKSDEVKQFLVRIQHDIFTVSAELAALTSQNINGPAVTHNHVEDLEKVIDTIQDRLPVQKSFIIPGGSKGSALLHLARCVARRTERKTVTISQKHDLNPELLKYINRLSDVFYVLARYVNNQEIPEQEPIYKYFEN